MFGGALGLECRPLSEATSEGHCLTGQTGLEKQRFLRHTTWKVMARLDRQAGGFVQRAGLPIPDAVNKTARQPLRPQHPPSPGLALSAHCPRAPGSRPLQTLKCRMLASCHLDDGSDGNKGRTS